MTDWTLYLYGVHTVVDAIGLAMMTWWIYIILKAKKYPSIFYVCLWLMFLGGVENQATMFYARSLKWIDPVAFNAFVSGWWWPFRLVFNFTANSIVVMVLIYRRLILSEKDH